MDLIHWLGLVFAGIAGAVVAFFRIHYMPPQDDEIDDTPIVPPEPIKEPEAPVAPETPSKATLENLCLALRDFEGKPGDQNYRLNNPGNCRYNPTGYLKKYGTVGRSKNGFAIFETYDLGWLYLREMIKNQIKKNPTWTLRDFIYNYAPPEDENPTENYGRFLGKRLGVDMSFPMKDLVV